MNDRAGLGTAQAGQLSLYVVGDPVTSEHGLLMGTV